MTGNLIVIIVGTICVIGLMGVFAYIAAILLRALEEA